jgi:autophagy-related protein 2
VNQKLKEAQSPLELVDGYIGDITIMIPWSSLMESSTTVEIRNLEVTVQAKGADEKSSAWLSESTLWSSNSMELSLRMAQDIQKEESNKTLSEPKGSFEGEFHDQGDAKWIVIT